MTRQLLFAFALFITLGGLTYTGFRLYRLFQLTKACFPVRNLGRRFLLTLSVAFAQTKIFRHPLIGFLHALVFWGFCVIALGSIEMIIDGLSGHDRSLAILGIAYTIITASGDVFALLVGLSILVFLFRRLFLQVRRFQGIEMKHVSHLDANIALGLILLLMISLLGINTFQLALGTMPGQQPPQGLFPVSGILSTYLIPLGTSSLAIAYHISWWTHILLIFLFANILPYSKHFHVFMSIPNVFLSRLEPLGKMDNMDSVSREVKLMLDPSFVPLQDTEMVYERFGIKDVEDISWKNYLDSLACTECGRCTAVCPANLTGKRLSPRKIIMDVRARMKEKGPCLVKTHKDFDDHRSLLRDYITEEELWACTTCNACARECPVNINHPGLILDLRRYLVMEEASAPGEIKVMFNCIENNGAPWQFSREDRMLWAQDIVTNQA